MSFSKSDLEILENLFEKNFEKQEIKLSDKIDFAISQSELRMESKIYEVKDEILEQMHREISAMTEMHVKEIETIEDHEGRITKIENKLKLTV